MLLEITVITGSLVISAKNIYQKRKKKYGLKKPLVGFLTLKNDLTQRLLSSSLSTTFNGKDKQTQQVIVYTLASLVLLGLTILGSIGYPWLMWLNVPGLICLGIPILKNGYQKVVQERRIGTAVLNVLSISVLLGAGYYWICALIYSFYGLSEYLLLKVKRQSKKRLADIFSELPRVAWVQRGEVEIHMPLKDVQIQDIVVVYAGEIIPVDGSVIKGMASVDQHMLTGEAQPIEVEIGDNVFASSLLLAGKIYIRVEQNAEKTVVANIRKVLEKTTNYTSGMQLKGEIIAEKSALPTLAISLITWPIFGVQTAVGVLLLSYFGQEMKILAPLSILNYISTASSQQILIKDGRALEVLQEVDTIVFDKTGTLTIEQPHVTEIYTTDQITKDELLRYAAAAEYKQTHPIAKAILTYAEQCQLKLPTIQETHIAVGYGLRVSLDDQSIRVGSERFMQMEGMTIPTTFEQLSVYADEQGYSLIYIAIGNHVQGIIELQATIRPEAQQIIQTLQKRNLALYIMSGDREKPTEQLAKKLGIPDYFAETLPENKANLIEKLQKQGKKVCFIGDGINDAIALKKAHVSISLQGASSVATDTAQIILMDKSLRRLDDLLDITKDLKTNMNINLVSTIAPSVLLLGCLYFTSISLVPLLVLGEVGVAIGFVNAMWPKSKYKQLVSTTTLKDNV